MNAIQISAPRQATTNNHVIEFFDGEYVKICLEEAAETLRALRVNGLFPAKHKSCWPDVVQNFMDAYGYDDEAVRLGVPTSRRISQMDVVLDWLNHVNDRRHIVVLWGRAMGVKPGRIASSLRINRETVRRWHLRGIDDIVCKLNSYN